MERAEFDPKRFATSTDTLYLISKEGAGSTRAITGSGLSDSAFLPFLSQLTGDQDVTRRTSSIQKSGRSVSTAIQRERLLDINDLAALPRGRAVLSTSGLPPALIELQHYSTQPYGADVTASKDYYEHLVARSGTRT